METEVKIIQILQPQKGVSKSGNNWMSLDFIGETQEQYSRKICFQVFGEEKCNNFLNYFKNGDVVKVCFDVESSEFNGRWFTKVRAWKVELIINQQAAANPMSAMTAEEATANFLADKTNAAQTTMQFESQPDDNLPF